MNNFTIEQMITGSFVKYTRLSKIINETYYGSNATEINLFIDLNSILKPLYSIDAWSYKYKHIYEIAATVLNMCGHYREFFKYIGVSTNIFLIYGLNCPTLNDTFIKGYNSKFINSYIKKPDITELISNNLAILKLITQYIPKIYFFDIGTNEVSAMVDYIINYISPLEQRETENLVISKDILMLQLVPEHNVRILKPNKTKEDGDLSYISDLNNLIRRFCVEYRKGREPDVNISPYFLQNILTMTRLPERSIYGDTKISIPKAIHIIDQAVKNRFLVEGVLYTQSSMNTVLEAMNIQCNRNELDMKFRAINTHYQSKFILLTEKPEFKILNLIDLDDPINLKEIVSKYFDKIPIDLDRLNL